MDSKVIRGSAFERKTLQGRAASVVRASEKIEERAVTIESIRQGDAVMFDRLDLAELLGIWRHARGRIVFIRTATGTVDVEFEGHAVLRDYLPTMFRRVH